MSHAGVAKSVSIFEKEINGSAIQGFLVLNFLLIFGTAAQQIACVAFSRRVAKKTMSAEVPSRQFAAQFFVPIF
jgi:hypothetical protein